MFAKFKIIRNLEAGWRNTKIFFFTIVRYDSKQTAKVEET